MEQQIAVFGDAYGKALTSIKSQYQERVNEMPNQQTSFSENEAEEDESSSKQSSNEGTANFKPLINMQTPPVKKVQSEFCISAAKSLDSPDLKYL